MTAVRLAMWSGPRNISTALMRAWENRPDSRVVDEPLYACYLAATGVDHPGRDEVLAAGDTDWRSVVTALLAPVPDDVAVVYHKQMAHHLLPEMGHDWVPRMTNVLLVREPREVVASYLRSRDSVTADDIGLPQQVRLYDALAATDEAPPVIDAADFLGDPEGYLRALCDLVGVEFTGSMLAWPPGPRDSDGIWGRYWYDAVWASTGFAPYERRHVELDTAGARVAEECRPLYDRLHEARWRL